MSVVSSTEVNQAFEAFPASHRGHLLQLREWILDVASELDATGGVEETLKWGDPSYLPLKPRVGTTVRLGVFDDDTVALYVHCQTTLVETFRLRFGDQLSYSKHRAVLFDITKPLPEPEIRACVRMALCYHLDKRQGGAVKLPST
ncbi:MAG: DUF1801 domain-containing protein [Cyanobacteria bacterium J06638_6]